MLGRCKSARLAGVLGMLVAVPLMGGLWEVLRALYVEPMIDRAVRSAALPDTGSSPGPDSGQGSGDDFELLPRTRESGGKG